jgi:hypothetical protein
MGNTPTDQVDNQVLAIHRIHTTTTIAGSALTLPLEAI